MGTFGVKRASDESFCPSTVVESLGSRLDNIVATATSGIGNS